MAVDLAHASPRLLDALLTQTQARIFCSHTGVAALGARWRNLDDTALRRIAPIAQYGNAGRERHAADPLLLLS
jgi:microsomal dipeptidase-like Zn-dependent dipeptidase